LSVLFARKEIISGPETRRPNRIRWNFPSIARSAANIPSIRRRSNYYV